MNHTIIAVLVLLSAVLPLVMGGAYVVGIVPNASPNGTMLVLVDTVTGQVVRSMQYLDGDSTLASAINPTTATFYGFADPGAATMTTVNLAAWTATRSFPPATLIFSTAVDLETGNIYGNVPNENGGFVLSRITNTQISTVKQFPPNIGAPMTAAATFNQVYYILTFDSSGNRSICSVNLITKQITMSGQFSADYFYSIPLNANELYLVDTSLNVSAFNLMSSSVTYITGLPLGFTNDGWQQPAYDNKNNVLYVVAKDSNSTRHLVAYNLTKGSVMQVVQLAMDAQPLAWTQYIYL